MPFIKGTVETQGIGGAAKVCLAASIFLMIFCVLRLGRHVAKVPHAVVSGFSCGIGAMMVIFQLRDLLGLPKGPGSGSSSPMGQLVAAMASLGQARWEALLLGTIVVAGVSRPLRGDGAALRPPRCFSASRWPSPSPRCWAGAGEGAPLGVVTMSIPPMVAGFTWQPSDVRDVLPAAMGLAFVVAVNILITSRVVEHFQGRHRPLRAADADAELGAYGIANLCAGVFGAPLSVGIPARSLANVRCGGTTRLSNFLHAVFLLLILRLGSGLIAHVPLAALAGVTAYVGIGLLEWSTWRRLHRMRRLDASAFLVTAAAVLTINPVAAVALGCSFYVIRHYASRLIAMQAAPAVAPR